MTTATATLINITSVRSESVAPDRRVIRASWKSTEKRTIAASNTYRAVELPANLWSENTTNHNKQFSVFIDDAIADLAREFLSTIVEESNWQRTQVNEDAFSLASLLAWNAQRAELSGRLNGDEIKAWLKQSVTIKHVASTYDEKIAAALGEQFVKLASPNHGLTAEKATKLLTNIWQAGDSEHNTGLRVMLRLTAISEKTSSANVLDSIL